jgi:hypothetical protein
MKKGHFQALVFQNNGTRLNPYGINGCGSFLAPCSNRVPTMFQKAAPTVFQMFPPYKGEHGAGTRR